MLFPNHLRYEEVLNRLRQNTETEQKYVAQFKNNKSLDIYYEDMVSHPKREFQRVTDMLELDPFIPKWAVVRQNPEKLSNLIINYDELRHKFQNTPWQTFFED